jgi:hypothetical protein
MNFLAAEDINQSDMPDPPVDPGLGQWKFLSLQKNLIALVLVLLLNSFLYCPRAAHSFSKETRSVKALLLGQSKTSYYKVLLYEHSINS